MVNRGANLRANLTHLFRLQYIKRPSTVCTGKLKVGIVMPQGKVAGAERVLLELLEGMLTCEVVIFAPEHSELATACRSLGYTVYDFSLPKIREHRLFPLLRCGYYFLH